MANFNIIMNELLKEKVKRLGELYAVLRV